MTTLRPSSTAIRRLRVERLGEEGEGVGRLEGVDVHVPGAFPGEEVEVRIEAVSRHHPRAHARLVSIVTPHPLRRESPCPRDVARGGRCTGCPLSGLAIDAQREAHRATLEARYGIQVDAVIGARELGYRFASKRIAFDAREGIDFGSYVRGSHRPASMEGCLVEHPRIEEAVAELRAEARARGIRAAGGVLEGVWVKTDGERVLLTLLGATPPDATLRALAGALVKSQGVHHSRRVAGSDALRGQTLERLAGIDAIEIELEGVRRATGPLGFLQPNPEVASLAYRALVAGEARGRLAFDLYAGAGVTTELLRRRFERVVPCESFPESAAALGVPPKTAEDFLREALARGDRPELVVANPPRGGMGATVTEALLSLDPSEIRVMSCSAKTLARDLAVLERRFARVSVEAFDTLPQTGHLELVAVLRRRG